MTKCMLMSLVITSSLLSACATRDFLPVYERDIYLMQRKTAGVTVSIEPLIQQDLIDKYFGIDLIGEGVLPVHVRVANTTPKSTYYIDEQAVALDLGAKKQPDDRSKIDNTVPMSASAGTATLLFAPIGVLPFVALAGGKGLADASVINYTFNQNKLRPNSIAPGEQVSGFVYFLLPDKKPPRQWHMNIIVTGLAGAKTEDFNFEYTSTGGEK